MALDFDVDDGPSFDDLVRSKRDDVLKGRMMSQCWTDLADQHLFFKDIAKEGRLRGESVGVVLAAVEGISRVIMRTELVNTPQGTALENTATAATASSTLPPANTASAANADNELHHAEVLVRVADAYLCLYSSTPVPTRAQWHHSLLPAVQGTVVSTDDAANIGAGSISMQASASLPTPISTHTSAPSLSPSSSSSSVVGRYLSKLRGTLQTVTQQLANPNKGDDSGGEDGSFAEEELKELVRCCVASGRRAARHPALSKTEGKAVREMVKVLQDYAGSSTLEW
ncbi:hypothetical protein ABB37_00574 [Leptomonas pyrrhocoris]|uniref:Uncharacterized protein n=1 Tax=Leptomonas pyrrhocoris TaxID=157538 RepID=A0A0M9GAN7_LEPPY|nr:hypothetical protein ABB37_00574 [Leptomonas pyrrhocoris]KPA86390.1 hypothetical protein ABB37_00574 [Leptomonas pyrrhocoris]|eukprot:XP_015664829.1 hypothetical protein ABB37_00574 [Leptomonas pyrrhocoris]